MLVEARGTDGRRGGGGGGGDSTAIHHARWLSRRKSITGVRATLGRSGSVWLPGRSLFHSAGHGSGPAPLLASSLFIYMRPRRPLCRWKSTDGRSVATMRRTGPAYYCITPAGRVTNGDRSPPGPAGLTCCRSARSHITSTYWSAVVGVG